MLRKTITMGGLQTNFGFQMFPYLPKGLHRMTKWEQKLIIRGGPSHKLRMGDVPTAKSVREWMT
jgi:hypothetical protein